MPKIFKKNKYALLIANVLIIFIWILISRSILSPILIQRISGDGSGNIIDLIFLILVYTLTYAPIIWITWFLWIIRGGWKR